MTEGHYTTKFRKLGECLRPHFFEPDVLDKFRNDPNYEVHPNCLSGKDYAPIELSSLQQYMWARKRNGEPCVAVLLPHLPMLSERDQLHFLSHELSSQEAASAKIEARYKKPLLYGEFPDTISCYQAIFLYLREVQRIFDPDVLLPNLPKTQPDFLAPLAYNSRKAITSFAQDLYSLLSMRLKTLANHLKEEEGALGAVKCVEDQRSRDLLRLYFESHALLTQEIEDGIEALRQVNKWRVESAHKLVAADRDDDYLDQQMNLVDLLQRGVRAMLLGFAQAEKGSTEVICERILKYCVA